MKMVNTYFVAFSIAGWFSTTIGECHVSVIEGDEPLTKIREVVESTGKGRKMWPFKGKLRICSVGIIDRMNADDYISSKNKD